MSSQRIGFDPRQQAQLRTAMDAGGYLGSLFGHDTVGRGVGLLAQLLTTTGMAGSAAQVLGSIPSSDDPFGVLADFFKGLSSQRSKPPKPPKDSEFPLKIYDRNGKKIKFKNRTEWDAYFARSQPEPERSPAFERPPWQAQRRRDRASEPSRGAREGYDPRRQGFDPRTQGFDPRMQAFDPRMQPVVFPVPVPVPFWLSPPAFRYPYPYFG